MEDSYSTRGGAVRSVALTGASTAAVSGSAAALGIILSRKFGHGVKTDGFFAAYGVYLVLALVASSLRVIVLPRFAAARQRDELSQEVAAWSVGLAVPLVGLIAVGSIWPLQAARLLVSDGQGAIEASRLLPWVLVAAAAQILAGVIASALAALDDYDWAAFGFAAGAILGVGVVVASLGRGIEAFGWGLAANGALALAVPFAVFLRHSGLGRPAPGVLRRIGALLAGVSFPMAAQGLYIVGYRFAGRAGEGAPTSFSYAYLIAAFLVALTAGSAALVATVPFARLAPTPARIANHVVALAWLSMAVVAAGVGIFASAGEPLIQQVLGGSYDGIVGEEISRVVAAFGIWMIASIVTTSVFPLVLVEGRDRVLPIVALTTVSLAVPTSWLGERALGLPGIALGLGAVTALAAAVLLHSLGCLRIVASHVARGTCVLAVVAAVAFGLPRLFSTGLFAAIFGSILYLVTLKVVADGATRRSWTYLRGLK